jgi:hypothetical protein
LDRVPVAGGPRIPGSIGEKDDDPSSHLLSSKAITPGNCKFRQVTPWSQEHAVAIALFDEEREEPEKKAIELSKAHPSEAAILLQAFKV